jgi:hypothetical protein
VWSAGLENSEPAEIIPYVCAVVSLTASYCDYRTETQFRHRIRTNCTRSRGRVRVIRGSGKRRTPIIRIHRKRGVAIRAVSITARVPGSVERYEVYLTSPCLFLPVTMAFSKKRMKRASNLNPLPMSFHPTTPIRSYYLLWHEKDQHPKSGGQKEADRRFKPKPCTRITIARRSQTCNVLGGPDV